MFKDWPKYKLHDLNERLGEVTYKHQTTVYDLNQASIAFFIVQKGVLTLETCIEVDSFYKIPVSKNQWQINKKTKKISY